MNQVFNKAISNQGARFHPTFGVDVRDAGELPLFKTQSNPKVGQYGYTRTNKDGSRRYHGGIDICGSVGSSIYAAHAGKISRAGYQLHPGPEGAGFGLRVYVEDSDNVQSVYAHLSGIIVVTGDRIVLPGQLIGFMGRSGNLDRLTKTHVHFEIRLWNETKQFVRIDPELWLAWKEAV